MLQMIAWLRIAAAVAAARPGDVTATRIGPDRYMIDGTAVVLRTAGCTVTSDRHPVRISGPDARRRRWVYFVGEGDPCLAREVSPGALDGGHDPAR